jgi:mxaJ protein
MRRIAAIALLCGYSFAAHAALVVCADPNNMPFSNRHQDGFENRLASLLARDLHMAIKYEWWAQRRGFARQTLTQSRCDIWPGVAAGIQSMATSTPYYRSTYVFVSLASSRLDHLSLDDPRLPNMLIGVQLVGDDGLNTPPASALAARGMTSNVRGFPLYGDYRRPNPPKAIMDAVVHRSVKLAVVWGPLAGYYARHSASPLHLQPIAPDPASPAPMSFAIAVGVRRTAPQLLGQINDVLQRDRPQIEQLLHQYGVPLVPGPATLGSASRHSAP